MENIAIIEKNFAIKSYFPALKKEIKLQNLSNFFSI
jgi:hypothetical protein